MTPEAWFVVVTILLVVAALATNRIGVDTAMMGGLTVLLVGDVDRSAGASCGVTEGISGFAHPAIFHHRFGLFVVAAGLQETGRHGDHRCDATARTPEERCARAGAHDVPGRAA